MRNPQMLRRSSGIYVPSYIEAELQAPPVQVQGLVGWELKRDGKVIRDSGGLQPNMIMNAGLDNLALVSIDGATSVMNVGTGSTAPAVGQTTLVAEVATARAGSPTRTAPAYVTGPPAYWYRRATYTFLEAFANGNLTEVACFQGAGAFPMWMRQLLKDAGGVPTTVTKTNLDQLVITYEWRFYHQTADVVTSLTFSGTTYAVTTRPHSVTNALTGQFVTKGPNANPGEYALETDVLVAINAAQAQTAGGSSASETQTAYVNGNYYLEWQGVWDIADANFATGIGIITHYGIDGAGGLQSHMFQSQFVPKIAKTNTKKLTMYFRRYWARYP